MANILLRISAYLLLISLALLAHASLALVWLQSSHGRDFIARQIEDFLSHDQMTAEIGKITRIGLRHLDLSSITLRDADGLAMDISELSLTIDTNSLLSGKPILNDMRIGKLVLDHIPRTENQSKSTKDSHFLSHPSLPWLKIDNLDIRNIWLTQKNAPELHEAFNLSGHLALSPHLPDNALDLVLTATTGTELARLTLKSKNRAQNPKDNSAIILQANIQDDGAGPLSRITGLAPIMVEVAGAGDIGKWAGNAKIKLGSTLVVQGRLDLTANDNTARLVLTGYSQLQGRIKTIGHHSLSWQQKTGDISISLAGQIDAGDFRLPKMALNTTLLHHSDARTAIHFTALAQGLNKDGNTLTKTNISLTGQTEIHGRKLVIKTAQLDALGGRINTKGFYDMSLGTFELDLNGDLSQIHSLAKLSGAPLTAKAKLNGTTTDELDINGTLLLEAPDKARLDTQLKLNNGQGRIVLSGLVKDTKINGTIIVDPTHISTDDLTLAGGFGRMVSQLNYDLSSNRASGTLAWQGSHQTKSNININFFDQRIDFDGNFQCKGIADHDITFAGQATLTPTISATISQLGGKLGQNHIALASPASILATDNAVILKETALKTGDGQVILSGTFRNKNIDGLVQLTNMPTNWGISPFLFDGKINGTIEINGPYTDPAASIDLSLDEIRIPGLENTSPSTTHGIIKAQLNNGILRGQSTISGTNSLTFTASGEIPMPLLSSNRLTASNLAIDMNGQADLHALTLLLGLDQHRLRGQAHIELAINGTIDNPQLTGHGSVKNAGYENIVTGMALKNINAEITAENDILKLYSITGTDQDDGSFEGYGEIIITNTKKPEYSFDITTKKLSAISLDLLGLRISGNLRGNGNSDNATLSGNVTIDHAEYYITQGFRRDTLSNFEIENIDNVSLPMATKPPSPNVPDIGLDISLKTDHGIYIRGPDLESEWSSDLRLGGTMNAPTIDGTVKLVRGSYRLLDTTALLKTGTITFVSNNTSDPDIDLGAEIRGHGEVADIHVTGTAHKPSLSLSARNGRPNDELLARVLFGQSLDQLSPMQALRIAQLLAILSGHDSKGTFDPLSALRRSIGVDTLSMKMDEENGATLSVGKYINDDIYLSVDQGATTGSSAVRAEIELTDEIELETTTNAASETTIGVNWKRDY